MNWVRKALTVLKPEQQAPWGSRGDGSEQRAARDGSGRISFSHTRVLSVSGDVLRRNKIVAMEGESGIADQFKLLRTHLFHRTRPSGLNTIQITGFNTGEGKSLVAVNLAISIARDARQTTLLVDLDLRNPSVHKLLGMGEDLPGLKSYFLDGAQLEDIFVSPGIEKLSILPAGGRIAHSTELIGSPTMEALVKELKERYPDRYVIFDTPPITECPDPLVFSEYVDGLILVARSDFTTSDSVRAAMDLVPRQKVLGIVLNDTRSGDV